MSKLIDMTGQKFGRLLVIGPHKHIKDKYEHSRTMWQCKCECNTILWINRDLLLRKNQVQCLKCNSMMLKQNREKIKRLKLNFRLPIGEAAFNSLFLHYKSNAKLRNLLFELSKEQFRDLTSSNCHYCGIIPSTLGTRDRFNGQYVYNGIDRKNNSMGYLIDNCVPCCEDCNKAKLTRSYEQFVLWIKAVHIMLGSRGEL